MDINEIKKCINDTIKSYKIERSVDTYNTMGLNPIDKAYQIFAPNFATLPDNILVIFALSGFTLYENLKYGHSLTDEINALKILKKNLKDENFENIDKNSFEKCLTKRKSNL